MGMLLNNKIERQAKLVSLDSDTSFDLTDFPFLMGRDRNACHLLVEKKIVSRKHAQITIVDDNWFIEDLGSTSGTFLNGNRLEPSTKCLLSAMDSIYLGNHQLTFYIEEIVLADEETDENLENILIDVSDDDSITQGIDHFKIKNKIGLEEFKIKLMKFAQGYPMEDVELDFFKEIICDALKVNSIQKDDIDDLMHEVFNESPKQTVIGNDFERISISDDSIKIKQDNFTRTNNVENASIPEEAFSDETVIIGMQPSFQNSQEQAENFSHVNKQPSITKEGARTTGPKFTQEKSVMPKNPYNLNEETAVGIDSSSQPGPVEFECPVFHPIMVEGDKVQIPVTKTPFTIGKSALVADFQLNARGVSKAHCLITFHGGLHYISDLGSTNGVVLNRKRLKPHKEYKLKNGDKINIGANQFYFDIPQ